MAYEYKDEIENHIICALVHVHVDGEVFDELEEVYAKAKAFDEILKLEKETSLYSVAGKEDVELGTESRKIINKYMEDK